MPAPHTSGGSSGARRPAPRPFGARSSALQAWRGRRDTRASRRARRSIPAAVRPSVRRSRTEPTLPRGVVMSMTASPSSTPTRRPPPATWNWQSFMAFSSDGTRRGVTARAGPELPAGGRGCPAASRQPEAAPEDLVASLLVEDLPLGTPFRHGPGVAPEYLPDLGVDRFLHAGLVRERTEDL